MQDAPSYVAHLLPVQLITGAGVGLTLPSLIAAGTRGLAPAHFGSGSGVLNMGRQMGTVIGVSALVAVLAGLRASDPIVTFHESAVLVIGVLACAAITGAATLVRRPAPAPGVAVTAQAA
jgi:hypothetical protein